MHLTCLNSPQQALCAIRGSYLTPIREHSVALI
nr:MAG TPA: hypothetical protein [Caudoviricetes sp.]